MEFVDQIRYWFATMVVATLPPAIVYWFVIHPFASLWRRIGATRALGIIFTLFGLSIFLLFRVRDLLLGQDLGRPALPAVIAGLIILTLTIVLQVAVSRQLTQRVLVGVPELSRDDPGTLLTGGIYRYSRNPRYLVIAMGVFAYSLLLNYSGVWIVSALSWPALYLIILMEEPELRKRFGEEYNAYCSRVPRLFPKLP